MLEIACFNTESALIAAKSGADRIEFCSHFLEGGLTPDLNEFLQLKHSVNIPIYVMIRPKGGNFIYSDEEFEMMKTQISAFKKDRADGFVFGILDKSNEIDMDKNRILVQLASPLPCTFHRAFDSVRDYQKSLERIIECGFKTILTSGTKANVDEGKEILKKLVQLSDNRIDILCGGGVRTSNILGIRSFTKAKCFHSSAIHHGEIADADEIISMKNILNQSLSDEGHR